MRAGLATDGRSGIEVIGAAGPSITNMEFSSKYPVVDPAQVDSVGYIQDFLLGELPARDTPLEGALGLPASDWAKFGTLRGTWKASAPSRGTIEERVKLAADLSKDFYADFVQRLEANNRLLADSAKKQRATS